MVATQKKFLLGTTVVPNDSKKSYAKNMIATETTAKYTSSLQVPGGLVLKKSAEFKNNVS